jgi:hypothetical protein
MKIAEYVQFRRETNGRARLLIAIFHNLSLSHTVEHSHAVISHSELLLSEYLSIYITVVKGKLIDEYKRRKGVPDSEDSSTALRASQKKNSVGESDRSCFFCKKSGHFKQDCFKYKKWKANNEKREKVNEVKDKSERSGSVCFSVHERKNQKDVWYIDSGATTHMSNDESFLKTLEKRKMRDVTVANGESAKVLGIGRGELHCLNGKDEAVKASKTCCMYQI